MRLRLALAALLSLPLLGGAAAAQADDSGVMAYTRDADGPEGPGEPTIYVASTAGGGEVAFTSGSAPALAPGEPRVAFARRAGGASQLFVARLDTGEAPRQVTALPDREGEFGPGRFGVTGAEWSPGHTRIAVRLMEGSTTTLGIVDAEGPGELRRLEFGHLFGSRIVWRDDDSLAVGTDEGVRLVTAAGQATPVAGAAQGDTPVAWDQDGRLVVNGADGIALLDVTAGTRELLAAGATAWDTYLDTGLLCTRGQEVCFVTPGDGAGTAPAVLDALPAGAQVLGAAGARSGALFELADAAGEPAIWRLRTSGGVGASAARAASRVSLDRVATGSDLSASDAARIGGVVPAGTPTGTATGAPTAAPNAGPPGAGDPAAPPSERRLAAAPGPVDPPPGRSTFAHALPAADEVSTEPEALLVNALLTALLMLLITFPSELFNNTLEKHYDEVRGWFGRRGERPDPAARPRGQRAAMFAGYTAAAAVLYALLDRDAGLDGRTARLWLGLLAGIVVVTLTFAAASLLYHRRRGSRGVVNVLPGTLLVAVACVAVSRLTRFEPGYMYGVVAGFAFATSLPKRDEGRAALLSAGWVLAAALAAWLVWLPVDARAEQGDAGLAIGLLDTTLAAIAVGGVQGLVIGLLPLRSLQGHAIAAWDRRAWAGAYALVLFVFLHLLLHPSSGFGDDTNAAPFFTWLGLFVGFGALSVAFWEYFERRPAPSSG